MEAQETDETDIFEMIGYVYRYAIYAIEDGLDDFKRDVIDNQGWTEEQAEQGYEMLQKLIVSLRSQASVVLGDLEG